VHPSGNGPKTDPGSSRRLRRPLRVRAEAPSPVMPDWIAPPGVSRPFSDIGGGIVRGGVASPVAVPQTTLSGLTGLPERSVRRSGVIGSPPPPRSFSRPRGVPPTGRPNGPKTARQLPQTSSPSQGSGRKPSSAMPGRVAPPGVSRPFSDIDVRGPYHPGLTGPAPSVLTVSHRLDGFLPPTPCGLAGSAAAHGVLALAKPFRAERPGRLSTSTVRLSSAVLHSLEL
jgi:hypothetical protein